MFINPVILAFLGAALVPAILHFLSRSQQQSRAWGAMRFLAEAGSHQGSAPKSMAGPALLALRTAAVALAIVALSRPVLGPKLNFARTPTGRSSLVLILDTSGSTSASAIPGVTRLDAIKEAGARILASLAADDVATLLTPDAAAEAFTGDRAALQSRIANLTSGDRALDLRDLLARAAGLLRARPAAGQRLIAVVTDRQANSYAKLDAAFAESWKGTAAAARVDRVLFSAVGDVHRDNVSVESISPGSGPVIRGRPAEVEVTLHNYGSLPRAGFPVRLSSPGVPDAKGTVDLPPRSDGSASVQITFPSDGRKEVLAECGTSIGPEFDDHLAGVIDVGEGVRVLAQNSTTTRPTTGPAGLAVAPYGDRVVDGAVVVPIANGRLPTYGLSDYDAVVIPRLARVTSDDALALTQYVYGGGGLVLAVSPTTGADVAGELSPMLPAVVGSRARLVSSGVLAAAGSRLPHELPFVVGTYYRDLVPAAGADVLAACGGDPILVSGKYGAGRVVLCAIPLEGGDGVAERSGEFVATMRTLVRTVVSSESRAPTLEFGAPLELALRDAVEPRSLELAGPDGRLMPVSADRRAGRWIARAPMLDEAGLWRLRYRVNNQVRSEPIAVRPARGESDLAPGDDAIRAATAGIGAVPLETTGALPLPELGHGTELWPAVLGLAGACLVGEQLLVAGLAARARGRVAKKREVALV